MYEFLWFSFGIHLSLFTPGAPSRLSETGGAAGAHVTRRRAFSCYLDGVTEASTSLTGGIIDQPLAEAVINAVVARDVVGTVGALQR